MSTQPASDRALRGALSLPGVNAGASRAILVIDEDSRIDLDRQPDFFEYADKLIKLPERQAVKVAVASIDHMRIQQQILLDNHIKQIRGFLRHHDGIVVPIIRTMEERGLRTAGEALQILQRN